MFVTCPNDVQKEENKKAKFLSSKKGILKIPSKVNLIDKNAKKCDYIQDNIF